MDVQRLRETHRVPTGAVDEGVADQEDMEDVVATPATPVHAKRAMSKADREARDRQLDGRVIIHSMIGKKGHKLVYWGTVRYCPGSGRRCLKIEWEDSSRKPVFQNHNWVEQRLQPTGTVLPAARQITPQVNAATAAAAAPKQVHDLSTMHRMLQTLMPGMWGDADVSTVYNVRLSAARNLGWDSYGVSVTDDAVRILDSVVYLRGCVKNHDLWSHSDGRLSHILGMLTEEKFLKNNPLGSDVSDLEFDAMQPDTYTTMYLAGEAPDVIVSSPAPEVLDIAVPMAFRHVVKATCFLVPSVWVTNPHTARRDWLDKLRDLGLVLHILGVPSTTSYSVQWLCLFKDKVSRAQMTYSQSERQRDVVFAKLGSPVSAAIPVSSVASTPVASTVGNQQSRRKLEPAFINQVTQVVGEICQKLKDELIIVNGTKKNGARNKKNNESRGKRE